MTLARHERDWQELGAIDPLWAVLGRDDDRGTEWDLGEFMARGAHEVTRAIAAIERLGLPRGRLAALDFGCGVGRVGRHLADHFDEVVGLDISSSMLEHALRFNDDIPNLRFVHNVRSDLSVLAPQTFDLVYCRLVLQHMPNVTVATAYIREFIRVLAPGGLALFEVPEQIPWRHRLQPQRRLYAGLRTLGVPPRLLYERLRLHPVRMIAISEPAVLAAVRKAGGVVAAGERRRSHTGTVKHGYYVTSATGAQGGSSDGSAAAIRSARSQSSG